MCWEHYNVIFGHQGVPLASRRDSGATYDVTSVSIVSVQGFKAVGQACKVW